MDIVTLCAHISELMLFRAASVRGLLASFLENENMLERLILRLLVPN